MNHFNQIDFNRIKKNQNRNRFKKVLIKFHNLEKG